jgi:enamine deaminase RidA (YjgF/YER057c/UK114 family)
MSGITRYPFPEGNHGQGPQSGDTRLQSGGALPFLLAAGVRPGGELVLFSGHTPPVIDPAAPADSTAAFGDTYTQTVGALRELGASLAALGLGFGNLVQLRALLVGDQALGGRMDSEAFSRAYAEFFGTAENPHLVARTRCQVVGLVNPGWLVELEAVAVR